MAHPSFIKRLLDLQYSNFELIDVRTLPTEIVWKIQHREAGYYECSRCGAAHDSAYDFKWIRLRDVPFGQRRCVWEVKRARILCSCSFHAVVVESVGMVDVATYVHLACNLLA